MKGITKAAKQANGRSHACATCPLNRSRGVCLPEIQRVCSDAFVEGFKKGVKWLQQKQFERERYNKELEKRNSIIKELQSENKYLHKELKRHVTLLSKKK